MNATNATAPDNPRDIAMGDFIATIPSPKEIRDRLDRNDSESKVLKKLLRLAIVAEHDREVRGISSVA